MLITILTSGANHPMTDDYNYYPNYPDYYYGSDHDSNRFNRRNKPKTHRPFNRYKLNYNNYDISNGHFQSNAYKQDFNNFNNFDYNNNNDNNNNDYYNSNNNFNNNNGNNNYAKSLLQNPYSYYNPHYYYQDPHHANHSCNNYKNVSFYQKQSTTSS